MPESSEMFVKHFSEQALIMRRGKQRRKSQKPGFNIRKDDEQVKLAPELVEQEEELTQSTGESANAGFKTESVKLARETSLSSQNEEERQQSTQSMANLETIQELRDFRHENLNILKEIKEDIREANSRIDNAEKRIVEAEEH